LEYLNIVYYGTFTTVYDAVTTDPSGAALRSSNYKTTVIHNFGYAPSAILVDIDSREIIGAQTFVQSVNSSYRVASLQMDSQKFYIRDRYYVIGDSLPSITRRYAIIVFQHPATVPSF
jgi:hypothetical protein